MEFIEKILDWPIIVQGALGSFLFWLFFIIFQKLTLVAGKKIQSDTELGNFFGWAGRQAFREKKYELSNYAFFVCIYAALHYFLKFVFAVFIGYLFSVTIPVFAAVGYLFGFYFLFRAISYVPHFSTFENGENKKTSDNVTDGDEMDNQNDTNTNSAVIKNKES